MTTNKKELWRKKQFEEMKKTIEKKAYQRAIEEIKNMEIETVGNSAKTVDQVITKLQALKGEEIK